MAAPTTKAAAAVLRGVPVPLDDHVGEEFVADGARPTWQLLTDDDIKSKWGLADEGWAALAENAPLLEAIRAERQRRIASGEATREAANRVYAQVPSVLGAILTDGAISPRHRIEAARELRA